MRHLGRAIDREFFTAPSTARTARGSIAPPIRRLLIKLQSRNMRSVFERGLHCCLVAARQWKQTFSGASREAAAHRCAAARDVDDRRQDFIVDANRSAGIELLGHDVSAMTSATGSPTCRTRSRARAHRGGSAIGLPSCFG